MKYLLFLCLFPTLLPAQSKLLNDPDIVWAKEMENDWVVDVISLDSEWEYGITTMKLLRTERNDAYWEFPFLAALVFQAAEAGKLPIFADPKCSLPVNAAEALFYTDTVITFNPETYEEVMKIVRARYDPYREVKTWRVREILAYNKKTASWAAQVEAVAPMRIIRNPDGDSIDIKPVFWFPVDNKSMKLSNNNVVWAKNIKSRQESNYYHIDGGQPVKISEGFQNPIEHQLKVFGMDTKTPFYDYLNDKQLTFPERTGMLSRVDTIVTFDPETYEEKVMVVRNDFNASSVTKIRLIHQWYWDEKRNRLAIVADAVGMMRDVKGYDGDFRYTTPFYYSRVRKK